MSVFDPQFMALHKACRRVLATHSTKIERAFAEPGNGVRAVLRENAANMGFRRNRQGMNHKDLQDYETELMGREVAGLVEYDDPMWDNGTYIGEGEDKFLAPPAEDEVIADRALAPRAFEQHAGEEEYLIPRPERSAVYDAIEMDVKNMKGKGVAASEIADRVMHLLNIIGEEIYQHSFTQCTEREQQSAEAAETEATRKRNQSMKSLITSAEHKIPGGQSRSLHNLIFKELGEQRLVQASRDFFSDQKHADAHPFIDLLLKPAPEMSR